MGDMGKEGSNLTLRVINGTNLTELIIRLESLKKGSSGIKVLADTACIGLANYAVEEFGRDDISHRHVASARALSLHRPSYSCSYNNKG
ncbi:hypothetical protein PRUPE_1G204400 [Prunus persica]|uniref:Uncharacterized protein n=1 Tax=Prunus persica TaxID=3760 RepID=A0A251R0J0_PRUPE|nr:hypothetical protein PRUPE_1G204400 [Prunus persica]